jgi:hypothetical protein
MKYKYIGGDLTLKEVEGPRLGQLIIGEVYDIRKSATAVDANLLMLDWGTVYMKIYHPNGDFYTSLNDLNRYFIPIRESNLNILLNGDV